MEDIALLLRYFEYDHLPEDQQRVSREFYAFAHDLVDNAPVEDFGMAGPEAAVGLRKLLEAKDCFVRASLD